MRWKTAREGIITFVCYVAITHFSQDTMKGFDTCIMLLVLFQTCMIRAKLESKE